MTETTIHAFKGSTRKSVRSRPVTFSLAAVLALTTSLIALQASASNLAGEIDSGPDNVANDVHVGRGVGKTGKLDVLGDNVKLTVSDGLFIGDEGGSGEFSVYNAAKVTVSNGSFIVGSGGGSGKVSVLGPGSELNATASSLTLGDATSTGTLLIQAATMKNLSATIGASSNATVENGGKWENNGALSVAGQLDVKNGGSLVSAGSTVNSGGRVTISGAPSVETKWQVGGALEVGSVGTGSLTVSGGAQVTSATGGIGHATTTGVPAEVASGKVTVTGAGSQWTILNTPSAGQMTLYVGSTTADYGQHGQLEITDGGRVSADSMMMRGGMSSGTPNYSMVTVSGANSLLSLTSDMAISSISRMAITDGGKVIVSNGGAYMGLGNNAAPSSVTVSGAGAEWRLSGALEQESGTVTIANGGAVTVGGKATLESRDAVINIGAAAGEAAVASGTFNAASIAASGGRVVFNHTDSDYTFATPVSGTADMDFLSGTTTLSGANSFTGASTVRGGTLRAGNTEAFSPNSAFSVNAGANMDLAGHSQQIASLNNAGTVYLNQGMSQSQPAVQARGPLRNGSAAPGSVLTVGDYVSNGGSMVFNTVLGDSASATDRLVINGMLTNNAATNVQVVNIGGLGARTTGDGILLIQTAGQGAQAADTFQLAPGARVAAGAYEYTLVAGAGANANNLYLSTGYYPPDNGTDPRVPDGGNGGGDNSGTGGKDGRNNNGSNDSTSGRVRPDRGVPVITPVRTVEQNYRVELPLASAITPLATEYGYAMLDTLHERVGDAPVFNMQPVYQDRYVTDARGNRTTVRTANPQSMQGEPQMFSGAWGRLIGDRGFHKPGSFEKHGPSYDYTFGGIQAGLDIYGREQAGSVDKAGLYFGYGVIDAKVKGAVAGRAGTVDSDAYTLGGYWTHKDAQGFYTDAVVQGTWYTTDATSTRGQKLKPDGFGIIASLEGGYSFKLGNGVAVEPQAQLAYQNVSFDNFSDAYGRFTPGDAESLRGRLGIRLNKAWNANEVSNALPFTTWIRANVWHEFMGDPKTTVTNLQGYNAYTVAAPLTGTWGEIGAGITGQVNENVSVFGTGAYNHSLDNKGREAWDGRVGVNMKW